MNFVGVVLPLVSVLIGSAITYWLNVRTRQRSRVEDVFHEAIAAVAVAVARHDFITAVAPWRGATRDEHTAFTAQLGREGNAAYIRAVADARAAIARASAYDASLRPFYRAGSETVMEQADEIMEILRRRMT